LKFPASVILGVERTI